MSSLSVKNLKNYVVLGIAVAAAYIFFQKDQEFSSTGSSTASSSAACFQ